LGIVAVLFVTVTLLAFVYTVPGNACPVDPDRLARVHVGMTKSEVRAILEDPTSLSDDGRTWYYSSTWSLDTLHVKFDESGRVYVTYVKY
jgi:outer membrane protein assembly factor BamE (lipoprotein component of BamABCDE complex)